MEVFLNGTKIPTEAATLSQLIRQQRIPDRCRHCRGLGQPRRRANSGGNYAARGGLRDYGDPRHARRIGMTTTDRLTDAPLLVTLPRVLKSEAETLAALCRAGARPIRYPQTRVLGRRSGRAAARFVRGGSGHGLFHAALRRASGPALRVGRVHLRGERISRREPGRSPAQLLDSRLGR